MRFATPEFLFLFIPLALLIVYRFRHKHTIPVLFSDVHRLKHIEDKRGRYLYRFTHLLRVVALILLVIILARPQGVHKERESHTEGIDIVLALDVSGSMRAEDFLPDNRLVVAKRAIGDFIKKRETDRMGLVVFSRYAFTQAPLTLDYDILRSLLGDVAFDMAGEGGTAIGLAIATSVNRLKASPTESKIIVLLTDGVNNVGEIDPETAANLAKTFGIKIYTIGIGKEGGAPIPFQHPTMGKTYQRDPYGNLILTQLDEPLLRKIAAITGGAYYRATHTRSLETIYDTINDLEKTEIKTKQFESYSEMFVPLTWLVLLLVLLEQLLLRFVLRLNP